MEENVKSIMKTEKAEHNEESSLENTVLEDRTNEKTVAENEDSIAKNENVMEENGLKKSKRNNKKKAKVNNEDVNQQKKAILEAVLFAMGDCVEAEKLAEAISENVRTVRKLMKELKEEYDAKQRGLMITELDGNYQMCTRPQMYDSLIKVIKAPRKYVLTESLLETLSIVAYKQPVTKMEIEKIRGVSCEHAVNRLLDFELIMEVGRKDAPGRPILLGTTEQFLRCFGVSSITDLPQVNVDKVALFRQEAEKEVQLKLDI